MLAPRHQPPSFPEIPGIKDLHTLVNAFLNHPEDIKEFLSDWLKRQKDYEKAVESYREVGNLEGLIAEAEKDRADTSEILEAAKITLANAKAEAGRIADKARNILDAAHVQALQIVADEKDGIDEVKSGLKLSAKNLKAREETLQSEREKFEAEKTAFAEEKESGLAEIEATQAALTIEANVIAERKRKIAAA